MRIASFNINGIRAAQRRGFTDWLSARQPDVVGLQEVRCPIDQLPDDAFGDYHLNYDPGSRAGRNGAAVLTRKPPAAVRTWGAAVWSRPPGESGELVDVDSGPLARGLSAFADEGRYLEVDLADQPLTVGSLYLPKGGLPAHLQLPGRMREAPDGGAKYERKMAFLDTFARQLTRTRKRAGTDGRQFLLLGDLNIAYTRYDLTHWRRSNQAEGFLPEERAWLDQVLSPRTLVDVVRAQTGAVEGPYSWWSWMGQAFEKNVGWRIDYHLATPALARAARSVAVDRPATREERVSDHAAVVVDYDLD